MAETEQHHKPDSTELFDEFEEAQYREPPRDWRIADRMLILMSLAIAYRLIGQTPKIPVGIKTRMMERMKKLIESYKDPKGVNRF